MCVSLRTSLISLGRRWLVMSKVAKALATTLLSHFKMKTILSLSYLTTPYLSLPNLTTPYLSLPNLTKSNLA
jgi:hypothetical protein